MSPFFALPTRGIAKFSTGDFAPAPSGGMTLAQLDALNRAWIGLLLNALLRPMFCRWRVAERAAQWGEARRYEILFLRMVDACDAYPYAIVIDRCGLWFATDDDLAELGMWDEEASA